MTTATILDKTLRAIPSWLRLGLLIAYALWVVGFQVAEGFDVEFADGWLKAQVLVGGYLGVQSAANVTVKPEVTEAPANGVAVDVDTSAWETLE